MIAEPLVIAVVMSCTYLVAARAVPSVAQLSVIFRVRCNIYISRLCYDVSVRLSVHLSVTEVHWRIIANLGFKFRSQFTAHFGHGACRREGRDHCREEWRDHFSLC